MGSYLTSPTYCENKRLKSYIRTKLHPVYQHVYGFIGASLIGTNSLPKAVQARTGVKTGFDLMKKQLTEDNDQFDHPEKYPGHTRIEAAQEIADDIAGIEAGNHIKRRYEGRFDSVRLRQNLSWSAKSLWHNLRL